MEIFLSNRLELLYQDLKTALFGSESSPLAKRYVVVYGPPMKRWLMLRMAQDPELNVSMGIEWLYLGQAFEYLSQFSSREHSLHLPTVLEMALAIEKELMTMIQNFSSLPPHEKEDWEPLLHYFKLNLYRKDPLKLSRRTEKRLIGLSQHVAKLFQEYGRFGSKMIFRWEKIDFPGWQPRLWRLLFCGNMGWTYSARILAQESSPLAFYSLYFFSISFTTSVEFSFLNRLSQKIPVYYYLLSPCALFWSDIKSDRETAYLHTFWQRKLGSSSPQLLHLEEFLQDRNPLLANFGRMGREMAYQMEESLANTHARYLLPESLKNFNEHEFFHEEILFTPTDAPLSLLHAVQADLLMMRNPLHSSKTEIAETESIQLHIAPNRRREIEVLYHNLLHIMKEHPHISPSDVIVMAPQIGEYAPYIKSIFGTEKSGLHFQILDLGMQLESELVQGFLQLLELSGSRWDAKVLLELFGHPSFQRRHQISASDYLTLQEWIEHAGIRWGEDEIHRSAILKRRHCEREMAEETAIGTWDFGLSRLLMGLTTTIDQTNNSLPLDVLPYPSIEFSQGELLEKWMHLLHALREDLSLLEGHTRLTMDDWSSFLICLLENYFQVDFEDANSGEEWEALKEQFIALRSSARFFKETLYSFESVKTHLNSLLSEKQATYKEEYLQCVRFCSLIPLRSIPAPVIALIGLQENAFPRQEHHSSLNLMIRNKEVDYTPIATDYDRYLFLEAIHAAQQYLILSYPSLSQEDGKELGPSLVVEELFSYFDKFYTVRGDQVSTRCKIWHPFDSFDARYFTSPHALHNFSKRDFQAAQHHYCTTKTTPYRFLSEFRLTSSPMQDLIPSGTVIDLKHLNSVARNPIKFHLNKVLEIYLETTEDRQLKTEEELIISSLDKYHMKYLALKNSLHSVFYRAEKEGKLPFGLFKQVATQKLEEEIEDIHTSLLSHQIVPEDLFQIEFSSSCLEPRKIASDHWLFPSVTLHYEEGYKIAIVGKIPHATVKGLISLTKGKETFADIWKSCPSALLYCHATTISPENWLPRLIFSGSRQPKEISCQEPLEELKKWVRYYMLCLENVSPLLPDWIPSILEGNPQALKEQMKKIFSDSFGNYSSHEVQWILNKHDLPSPDTIINNWRFQAELLMDQHQKRELLMVRS